MPEGRFVLVVDDDEPSARLLSRYLDALGYLWQLTSGGEEALEVIRANPASIGALLLDLAMPGVSGYDVCRTIRAEPELAHLPVIAITANIEPEYLSEAYSAGVNHLITKPVSRDELEVALADYYLSE